MAAPSQATPAQPAQTGTGVGVPGVVPQGNAVPSTLEPAAPPKQSKAHYLWAVLIARIYEVFPLLCPMCGGQMRLIAFITHSADIPISGKYSTTSVWTRSPRTLRRRVARRCGRTVMRR